MSLTVPDWAPAPIAWKAFCEANPSLGLAGTITSWRWANRTFAETWIAAGVMRKSASRSMLINTKTFAPIAFETLTTDRSQK